MKNLEVMFDEALDIVKKCIGEKNVEFIERPLTISKRMKRTWGMCISDEDGTNSIVVSQKILGDNVPNDSTMSVLIHEALHACKNCKNHGDVWKKYAEIINKRYPQYKITRVMAPSFFGLSYEPAEIERKYAIVCTKCGAIHYSSKMSKTIKYPSNYLCAKCNGEFKRLF